MPGVLRRNGLGCPDKEFKPEKQAFPLSCNPVSILMQPGFNSSQDWRAVPAKYRAVGRGQVVVSLEIAVNIALLI